MQPYQQTLYRPPHARMAQAPVPTAAPPAPALPPSGSTTLTITPSQRNMAIGLGVAELVFGVAATWTGVRAGLRERGSFKVLGWVTAAGGGIFALVNLLGTLGMVAKAESGT